MAQGDKGKVTTVLLTICWHLVQWTILSIVATQVAALVSTLTPDQVAAKQAEVVEAVSLQVALLTNVISEDIMTL